MRDHPYGHFYIEEVEALYKGEYCNKEREVTVLQETTFHLHFVVYCSKGYFEYIFLYLFQKNDTLKSLRMTGNKIGNKGGMWFAQALQVNKGLEALDVADTDLVSIWFSLTGGKC